MSHSIDFRRPGPRKRAAAPSALVLLLACSEPVGPERQQLDLPELPAATDSLPAGELAADADSFVDAISVQTQIERQRSIYGQFVNIVKPRLCELGVRHVREIMVNESDVHTKFKELKGDCGITLTAGCWPKGGNYTNASHCISRGNAYGDSVIDAFDGWNEVDNKLADWTGPFKQWQQTLFAAYNGDPTWADEWILASSVSHAKDALTLYNAEGNLSAWMDYGNTHSYPGSANLPSYFGNWLTNWNLVATPKPLVATETGYHNCIPCPNAGISYLAHGKYIPRLLFEYFNRGIKRTSIYELIDQGVSPTSQKDNWGLLKNDGTPKPAFTAIKNLIALLSDQGPAFTPGRLDYALSGALASTHKTLLQKRDGRFCLVLWREVRSWDKGTKSDVTNSDDAVTLTLAQPASSLKVFRPGTDTLPIQTGSGASIALSVPDEVIVVEVTL